jgi:hypothetical protein
MLLGAKADALDLAAVTVFVGQGFVALQCTTFPWPEVSGVLRGDHQFRGCPLPRTVVLSLLMASGRSARHGNLPQLLGRFA